MEQIICRLNTDTHVLTTFCGGKSSKVSINEGAGTSYASITLNQLQHRLLNTHWFKVH